MIACQNQFGLSSVQSLVAAGADVNLQNDHGETCLHLAARFSFSGHVAILLSRMSDVNAVDFYGSTVLHTAVCSGDLESVMVTYS